MRTHLPAAFASASFGFVLARRVQFFFFNVVAGPTSISPGATGNSGCDLRAVFRVSVSDCISD